MSKFSYILSYSQYSHLELRENLKSEPICLHIFKHLKKKGLIGERLNILQNVSSVLSQFLKEENFVEVCSLKHTFYILYYSEKWMQYTLVLFPLKSS